MMRRSLLPIAILLSLGLPLAVIAQSATAATQPASEALKAPYTQAVHDRDWQAAVSAAQKLVELRSTAENLELLAEAQLLANAPQDALATSGRALDAAEGEKPAAGQPDSAWKQLKSKIYLSRGNSFLKLRRNAEAIEAYNQSALLASNPGLAYFNICATLYNIGDTENGLPACRKSVEADPTRANAWFILGSMLFADAPIGGKGVASITLENRQALEKYLELAPDGPQAEDVKAMLKMAN